MAKVSVVIPVYNVEKYIISCLESVIHQTLTDIEIICVDDGSTDSCGKILDEYAIKDSRIQVIHKENGGYGKAMNTGMDLATGKYFAILESDDIIRPQMYERLYAIAEKYKLDIVKSDFCRFVVENGVLKETPDYCVSDPALYGKVLNSETDYKNILLKAPLYTWSGIYRLDFLKENGIRHNETPGASYQDNGFWFQTMSTAKRVYFHNEQFYMLRRDNPNSSFLSKGKVYCVRDEYDFILEYLIKRPELYDRLITLYWPIRFGAYMFTYKRIAPEYKLDFLKHTQHVFKNAQQENQLVKNEFYKSKWQMLNEILDDPDRFNRKHSVDISKRSKTYQFFIRWLWCYQDHGFIYTIKYTCKRIKNKFLPSKGDKFDELKSLIKHTESHYKKISREINNLKEELQQFKQENTEMISSFINDNEHSFLLLSQKIVDESNSYAKALQISNIKLENLIKENVIHSLDDMNSSVAKQLDNSIAYTTRNTRLLKEIRSFSFAAQQELLFAAIFNQYTLNSTWLTNKSFAPGRAAVGYNYLYTVYRCLDEFKPKRILDIGLGQSTKLISQYAAANPEVQHLVVENDQSWIDFFTSNNPLAKNTTIIKLNTKYKEFNGYENVRAYEAFDQVIQNGPFDLISIDAPISYDMEEYARIDILPFLPECLSNKFIILLDDYQRTGEQNTAKLIKENLSNSRINFAEGIYHGQTDLLVICSKELNFFTSL